MTVEIFSSISDENFKDHPAVRLLVDLFICIQAIADILNSQVTRKRMIWSDQSPAGCSIPLLPLESHLRVGDVLFMLSLL